MIDRKRKDKTEAAETSDIEAVPPVSSVTHEEIARCAYYIWEAEGRPEGRAVQHWLEAELQLHADRALDKESGTKN